MDSYIDPGYPLSSLSREVYAWNSTLSDTDLCTLCRGINIESVTKPHGYPFHLNLIALEHSAQYCQSCNLILRVIITTTSFKQLWQDIERLQHCRLFIFLKPQKVLDERLCLFIEAIPYPCNGAAEIKPIADGYLCLHTDEDDEAVQKGIPWLRKLPYNTKSLESFTRARSWLNDCCEKHDGCGKSSRSLEGRTSERPGHFIKLGADNSDLSAVLVEGLNVNAPYAALSYTWGGGPAPWRTTEANLQQRLQGFDRSELAATLQDALAVADGLGLQYIWIDSICIVQDDEVEWKREAAKMGAVYGKAYVTIAASASSSSTDGLFNVASRPQAEDYELVKLTSILSNGTASTLYLHDLPVSVFKDHYRNQVVEGPLYRRGWACQEAIMSPRKLHYTKTQIIWECSQCILTEDNLPCLYEANPVFQGRDWRTLFWTQDRTGIQNRVSEQKDDFDNDPETNRILDAWYSGIVNLSYSRRQLAFSRDKLIAISGLARAVYKRHPMQYLAGLWRPHLIEGLCWERIGAGRKIQQYRAPSWSWASQDSAVNHFAIVPSIFCSRCEVVSVEVTHDPVDAFGMVYAGLLVLDAQVMSATLLTKCEGHVEIELQLPGGAVGKAQPDDDDDEVWKRQPECLAVYLGQYCLDSCLLLVRRLPNSTNTVRIGFGTVKDIVQSKFSFSSEDGSLVLAPDDLSRHSTKSGTTSSSSGSTERQQIPII